MKKLFTLLFSFVMLTACVHAQETETRELGRFTSISAAQGIEVYVSFGDQEMAKIETNQALEDVLTEVSGGQLKIRYEQDNSRMNAKTTIYLTAKYLDGLKASSSAYIELTDGKLDGNDVEIGVSSSGKVLAHATAKDATVKISSSGKYLGNIQADQLSFDVSSSAKYEGEIEAKNLDVEVSSSGKLTMSGSADGISAKASSSGKLDAEDLIVNNADLKVSSSGKISLEVKDELNAQASSGGKIAYVGKPANSIKVKESSGGKVKSM